MSRTTVINERSDSVTGTFALHDLLSISSMSGDINIAIIPQSESSTKAPAEVRLTTASGSIHVTMAPFLRDPSAVIPNRDFKCSIESASGSITAALIHNHETALSTLSGNIAASFYPVGQPSSTSQIDIQCLSGATSVALNPHIRDPQASLKALSLSFQGSSGGLRALFPSTWEGDVVARLMSGRVRHRWEGLNVLVEGPEFRARKGVGGGRVSIDGSSLDVELVAQQVPAVPRGEERAGESVPSVPREEEQAGESVPDVPRGEERRDEGVNDDDDEWTIIGDEDGAQHVTRRPPPSYEDATRR